MAESTHISSGKTLSRQKSPVTFRDSPVGIYPRAIFQIAEVILVRSSTPPANLRSRECFRPLSARVVHTDLISLSESFITLGSKRDFQSLQLVEQCSLAFVEGCRCYMSNCLYDLRSAEARFRCESAYCRMKRLIDILRERTKKSLQEIVARQILVDGLRSLPDFTRPVALVNESGLLSFSYSGRT